MAIALVATRLGGATGVGTFTTNGTFSFSPLTNCTTGNILLLSVAMDPASPTSINQFVSVSDTAQSNWIQVAQTNFGNSGTGASVQLFWCRVNRPITTSTVITVFSAWLPTTTTRIACLMDEFSGVSSVFTPGFTDISGPNFGVGTTTTAAVPAITPSASGQLVYGVNAIETNTAVTGDADTTNGSWSAIATQLSNSGSDLTSMTLNRQYKIVTAAGAQNWATTTAVAKNWAALAAVLVPAAAHVAPAFPEGNPNYPKFAGFEGLPTTSAQLPVDTGTGYIYNYVTLPDELGSSYQVAGAEFVIPQELSQHHVSFDWYNQRNVKDASQDDIQTIYLPLRRAEFLAGNTLVPVAGPGTGSGTGSGNVTPAGVLNALRITGGDYVFLDGLTQGVDMWFDPTTLLANYANYRIVNFGIQYVAYRDDSATAGQGSPSQGFNVSVTDTLANVGQGFTDILGWWITAYYKKDNKYETRWFGETNARPRTNATLLAAAYPHTFNMGGPWRVQDLAHMGAADQSLKFTITGQQSATDSSQTRVFFDYVTMVVQLAPERRIGAGVRTVSNTYSAGTQYPFTFDYTRFQDALDTSKLAVANLPNNNYTVLVREAAPASESDYLRLQTSGNALTSLFEALGPSAQLRAFTQPRESLNPQPDTQFVPIVNGAPYGPLQDFSEYTSSVMVFGENSLIPDGPSFGGYNGLAPNGFIQVYSGHNQSGWIGVPGGTQYSYLKVLIKPDPALIFFGFANSITFSVQQPTGTPLATLTVSPSAWNGAAHDAGFGWKEIVGALSVPITPAAGAVTVVASSSAPGTTPWYWAAANPDAGDGYNGYAGVNGYEYAAVLEVALPTPTVTMSTITATSMERASTMCLAGTEKYPRLTFTNASAFDYIVVFRYDTMGEPIYVTTVNDGIDNVFFTDFAVPWDIPTGTLKYLIYGVRSADSLFMNTTVTWNDTSPNPGAALSLAYNPPQVGSLGQSIEGNHFNFDLIYAPADPSEVKLEWKSNNGATSVPLHGVDKFVQLRGTEQRGLSVSFTVLIDKFGVATCDTPSSVYKNLEPNAPQEQLAQGTQSMSPLVFGGDNSPNPYSNTGFGPAAVGMGIFLRELERLPGPITLKLPGGHTRLMNVEISNMMITPWSGLYMAELTLTDAAPLDYLATGIPITS